MPTDIDTKIASFISGKPWLKFILAIANRLLGAAKARNWFYEKYKVGK